MALLVNIFSEFQDFTISSVMLRMVMAMVFGGLIGLERERKRRAAGFRTYMLVCLGAALTMLLGEYSAIMQTTVWNAANATLPKTDVTRFAAQVINGIGFLGAGTIIVGDRRTIKGLTTAAGLWASACMGIAIGAGFYECAVIVFVLMVLCTMLLPFVEVFVISKGHIMDIYVEYLSLDDLGSILSYFKTQNIDVIDVKIERGIKDVGKNPNAIFTLWLNKRRVHSKIISEISKLDCICTIEEN